MGTAYVRENISNSTAKFYSGNRNLGKFQRRLKWNRTNSNFLAGLVRETIILFILPLNITYRVLCKANFILSKTIHDALNLYIAIS